MWFRQNFVVRTFSDVPCYYKGKLNTEIGYETQMETPENIWIRSIKKKPKPMNTRVRRGSPFQLSKGKDLLM